MEMPNNWKLSIFDMLDMTTDKLKRIDDLSMNKKTLDKPLIIDVNQLQKDNSTGAFAT